MKIKDAIYITDIIETILDDRNLLSNPVPLFVCYVHQNVNRDLRSSPRLYSYELIIMRRTPK